MKVKTYTHRVAIMESRQIIMDIEAPNDIESIKDKTLEAYFNGEGDQEAGMTVPVTLIVYPWLEEGQTPPAGSEFPNPTYVRILGDENNQAKVYCFDCKSELKQDEFVTTCPNCD